MHLQETAPRLGLDFPDGEIGVWACLGAVTDRSVRVWLRDPELASHTASVQVGGRIAGEAALTPSTEHDGIAAADITLDRPMPMSRFTLSVAGMERRGTLAPSPGTARPFAFAFGSCHQPFAPLPDGRLSRRDSASIYPVMRHVLEAHGAQFLLLMGDQIYSDGLPGFSIRDVLSRSEEPDDADLLAAYRSLYRGYFGERGFRRILETVPSCMMWDDHEIRDNWGSLLETSEDDRRLFRAGDAAFREYQHLHNPASSLADGPPYAYRFWWGDVGFLVLDLRSSRDYVSGQVIGEAQWRMLDEFLAEASERQARTLFVGVTIPVVHFSPAVVRLFDRVPGKHGQTARERWDSERFAPDRDRLMDALFDWQSAGPGRQVVLISGDVHAGAAFRVERRQGEGQLLQWTSSSLTAPSKFTHRMANRLGTTLVNVGERKCRAYCAGLEILNNFGVVEVVPLTRDQGHEVGLTLYRYDSKNHVLKPGVRVRSRPSS